MKEKASAPRVYKNRRQEADEAETERRLADRANQIYSVDRPVHSWYRFVLSFPPHLVREYLQKFGVNSDQRVLDPFCGTGTTIVECKKQGIPSVGIEANPMAYFASQTKVDWSPDPDGLLQNAEQVAADALAVLQASGIADDVFALATNGHVPDQLKTLRTEQMELLLTHSISPMPLHKTLVLLERLKAREDQRYHRHELLALAKALVTSISNLHSLY